MSEKSKSSLKEVPVKIISLWSLLFIAVIVFIRIFIADLTIRLIITNLTVIFFIIVIAYYELKLNKEIKGTKEYRNLKFRYLFILLACWIIQFLFLSR